MTADLPTTEMDPADLLGPHGITDVDKVRELAESMRRNGWLGAPLVVITRGSTAEALCGTHRIEAARQAEVKVPVVGVADLMAAHGQDWLELVDSFAYSATAEADAAIRLRDVLPGEAVDYYGLDLH